jgi:hypothetical protein
MFRVHSQYLDSATGFHVILLQDESGNQHVVQIAVGAEKCPACGIAYPKDNLGAVDPKAMIASVSESLNRAQEAAMAYAKKHGLKVKAFAGKPNG